jgi:hypothetical protein
LGYIKFVYLLVRENLRKVSQLGPFVLDPSDSVILGAIHYCEVENVIRQAVSVAIFAAQSPVRAAASFGATAIASALAKCSF